MTEELRSYVALHSEECPVEAGGKMGAMFVIRGTSTCSRSLAKKHKSVLP